MGQVGSHVKPSQAQSFRRKLVDCITNGQGARRTFEQRQLRKANSNTRTMINRYMGLRTPNSFAFQEPLDLYLNLPPGKILLVFIHQGPHTEHRGS